MVMWLGGGEALKLVKEIWLSEESKKLCISIQGTTLCEIASENLKVAQYKMKIWYDKKARQRSFDPGDRVLILLPIQGNPLQAQFHGPYQVVKKISKVDYAIKTPDCRKSTQLCHINMLKPYYERDEAHVFESVSMVNSEKSDPSVAITDEVLDVKSDVKMKLSNSQVLANLDSKINNLSPSEKHQLSELIIKYDTLFPVFICNKISSNLHRIKIAWVPLRSIYQGDNNPFSIFSCLNLLGILLNSVLRIERTD